MLKRDYLLGQVENITQLLETLGGKEKLDDKAQASVDQALSDLTGLDISLFAEERAPILGSLLAMHQDENSKALVARLLVLKNANVFSPIAEKLMVSVDIQKLDHKVRALFIK